MTNASSENCPQNDLRDSDFKYLLDQLFITPQRAKIIEDAMSSVNEVTRENITKHIFQVDDLLIELAKLHGKFVDKRLVIFYIQKYKAAYEKKDLLAGFQQEFEKIKVGLENFNSVMFSLQHIEDKNIKARLLSFLSFFKLDSNVENWHQVPIMRFNYSHQRDELIAYYETDLSSSLPHKQIQVFIEGWFHNTISSATAEELVEKIQKIRAINDFYVALVYKKSFISEANVLLAALAWDNIDNSLCKIKRYFNMSNKTKKSPIAQSKIKASIKANATQQNTEILQAKRAALKAFDADFDMPSITVNQRRRAIQKIGKKPKDCPQLDHVLAVDRLLCKVSKLNEGFKNKESQRLLVSFARRYPAAYLTETLLKSYEEEFEEKSSKLQGLDLALSSIEKIKNSTLDRPQIQQLITALVDTWCSDVNISEEKISSQLKDLSSIIERCEFINEQNKKVEETEKSNIEEALAAVALLLAELNKDNIRTTLDDVNKIITDRNVGAVVLVEEQHKAATACETIKSDVERYQTAYTNASLLDEYNQEFEEKRRKLEEFVSEYASTEISQKADTRLPEENKRLIALIDHLRSNIENGKNRWTSGKDSDKCRELRDKGIALQKGGNVNFDEELAAIKVICQKKRNPLHFWKTPESVAEFDTYVKNTFNKTL